MIKCIIHNMPVSQAIEYTGTKGSRQGLYQRIAQWRNSLARPNLAQLQAIEEEWNTPPTFSSSEPTASINESPTIDSPPESLLKGGKVTKEISPATMQSLADGPSWLDPDKMLAAMTFRIDALPPKCAGQNLMIMPKNHTTEGNTSALLRRQQ